MNKKIIFKKMQGLGNDFILIDSQENPDLFTNKSFNLKPYELAKIANRNYGIGCDQILIIMPSSSKLANYDYLIYNQDGTSAGYCGNGARCVIRYIADKYQINLPITLNTNGRLSTGCITSTGQVTIHVGYPDFSPQASNFVKDKNEFNHYSYLIDKQLINFGIVSIGNPHAILSLDNLEQLNAIRPLARIAEAIGNSGLFIEGVNVSFFVIDSPKNIRMRTYERGAGFTLACGSGACATASFAIAQKYCGQNVNVLMPGGTLEIYWDMENEIKMTGDAAYVFEGIITL
ncbi:MAG: diaminopimelate epimerase [Burkholderiales bacterium]|jgi:diaminopimelate epimerase|nr:diaminopimelate epimerase [Burkholderiales bacterium]